MDLKGRHGSVCMCVTIFSRGFIVGNIMLYIVTK